VLSLAIMEDLAVQRDAAFTIANMSDSGELQTDLVREGVVRVVIDLGKHINPYSIQHIIIRIIPTPYLNPTFLYYNTY
jgi:hypothetical protein